MNKKGFAISAILYSITFLIITVMFMLLGIVKTRYTVTDKLREEIVSRLDDVHTYSLAESIYTCTISGSSNDYTPNLVLTINVSNNKGKRYSFDGYNYSGTNEILATHSGEYVGYFEDVDGNYGSCSVDLISTTMYHYQDCSDENKYFGEWYKESDSDVCEPVTMDYAERYYLTYYRECPAVYYRKVTGCNWNNETSNWSNWSTTNTLSTLTRKVETASGYKMR